MPFRRVTDLVRPARDALTHQIHETCYWKHWDKRPKLYETLGNIAKALVCGRVSKYVAFAFVPAGIVFSDRLVVVASDRNDLFTVLQSACHVAWVEQLQTFMGQRVGYSISKCFLTFPWPSSILSGSQPTLAKCGMEFYDSRQRVMLDEKIGFTDLYNAFHNDEVQREAFIDPRRLQAAIEDVVLAAYGWDEVNLDHGFHETRIGVRYTISEPARREVLARLLKLNHERYAEEVKQGLHEKKKGAKKRNRNRMKAAGCSGRMKPRIRRIRRMKKGEQP